MLAYPGATASENSQTPKTQVWAREQWKIGILGSGKLRQWFIDKTLLTRKLIDEKLPYKIITPTFHYSRCEAIHNSLKKLL
jgi:hypothetical protein